MAWLRLVPLGAWLKVSGGRSGPCWLCGQMVSPRAGPGRGARPASPPPTSPTPPCPSPLPHPAPPAHPALPRPAPPCPSHPPRLPCQPCLPPTPLAPPALPVHPHHHLLQLTQGQRRNGWATGLGQAGLQRGNCGMDVVGGWLQRSIGRLGPWSGAHNTGLLLAPPLNGNDINAPGGVGFIERHCAAPCGPPTKAPPTVWQR